MEWLASSRAADKLLHDSQHCSDQQNDAVSLLWKEGMCVA